MKDLEKRFIPIEDSEIRVEGEGDERKITGYAAVFNRKSEDLGGFVEIIRPGAFRKAIGGDVRAMFNHDPNYVIGRTTNSTLALEENQKGLKFTAIPPDTQWARDLLTSIERGDISQCSFSFRVAKDGEKWTENKDGPALRELHELEYVGDVGPVTFPAYPQTSVQARSILTEAGFDFDAITALIARAQRGLPITDSDRDLINASIQILQSFLPGEDGGDASTRKDGDAQRLQNILTELDLVEIKHNLRGDKK